MQTHDRRSRIRALILENPMVTQEELVGILQEGTSITQSTLSRDLSEIGAVKRKGAYTFLDQPGDRLRQLGFLGAVSAGMNLIVVRTEIGSAQRVAFYLDELSLDGLIGTVAGDDTIFLAVSADSHAHIIQTLEAGS